MNSADQSDWPEAFITDKHLNLMDGAGGDAVQDVRKAIRQRNVSADPSIPLERRLEAYENIFDSEIRNSF